MKPHRTKPNQPGRYAKKELWATLGLFQRKYAPWVPPCAQPGTGQKKDSADDVPSEWLDTFDDR